MNYQWCSKRCICIVFASIIFMTLLVAGFIFWWKIDLILHHSINTGIVLKNHSQSYSNWLSPPAPIYFQVWVQNVTNAEEVVKNGSRPMLQSIGPFTYREKRKKIDIRYSDSQKFLHYKEKKYYYFDRAKSIGPETTNFTTINIPLLTIASMIRFWKNDIQYIVKSIINAAQEHLFISLSVSDILWGYEVTWLKLIKPFYNISDTVGLFKNGSDDGEYMIYGGVGGHMDCFAEIESWNGNESLTFWTDDIANAINGSDGTLYPPFVNKSKPYYLFSSDLCRSLEIVFDHVYTLKGIDVYRYVVPSFVFANVSVNPSNKGFCTPANNCLPGGLLNASTCKDGAPVVFSLPEFLYSSDDIMHRVVGMTPVVEEDQSVIDIEPVTGVVMNVNKRLQINMYLDKLESLGETQQLSDYIILPVIWLNESGTIDDASASKLKREVLLPIKVIRILPYLCIVVGGLGLLLLSVVWIKHTCRRAGLSVKADDDDTNAMVDSDSADDI